MREGFSPTRDDVDAPCSAEHDEDGDRSSYRCSNSAFTTWSTGSAGRSTDRPVDWLGWLLRRALPSHADRS